jgi:hypothetical protein
VLVVGFIITWLPSMGVGLLTGSVQQAFAPEAAASTPFVQIVLQQVGSSVVWALTLPFLVGSLVLQYYDRRVRSEGYDLQLVAERFAVNA